MSSFYEAINKVIAFACIIFMPLKLSHIHVHPRLYFFGRLKYPIHYLEQCIKLGIDEERPFTSSAISPSVTEPSPREQTITGLSSLE